MQVFLAAGGNPTGLFCYDNNSHRREYQAVAKKFMDRDKSIEQFGFLEGTSHIEMSGGEFCGNAARVAAYLICKLTGKSQGTFTISGYAGTVIYTVDGQSVRCVFPDYPFEQRPVNALGVKATLVDLGGIVHVVLPPVVSFINDIAYYKEDHTEVTAALGLGGKLAVGVIWQERQGTNVLIHPVVWVRGIHSFFYETSCGSGALATIISHNVPQLNIIQPSGQAIFAECSNGKTLAITSTVQRQ